MNERGVTLITVVIIMFTIALIGASLIELVSSVNLSTNKVLDETKARYLAEAGIAEAIYILRARAGAEESLDEILGPVPLGDGTYTVWFDFRESLITSIGTVNSIKKKLQLQYNVF
ncbi:MAG: hypothetical protein A3C47_03310 [Omnitrophica bacterium RIFCSPHIGHO2_02_FULL_51_18]|nr:MAG: hypothetical protein A3C47_03310 [Omnitrophica bacterium RIFCSPHIGHO2_02_FULL_51_18]